MKRRAESTFVLYDLTYDDGSLSSNRKVPTSIATGFDGEAEAKAFLEAQDREIGLASGRVRGEIKTMVRRRA